MELRVCDSDGLCVTVRDGVSVPVTDGVRDWLGEPELELLEDGVKVSDGVVVSLALCDCVADGVPVPLGVIESVCDGEPDCVLLCVIDAVALIERVAVRLLVCVCDCERVPDVV